MAHREANMITIWHKQEHYRLQHLLLLLVTVSVETDDRADLMYLCFFTFPISWSGRMKPSQIICFKKFYYFRDHLQSV